MIKINIYLRFAIIAFSLVAAILLTVFVGFWYAFPLYLVAIGLLVGYILLGTVQSAAELVQLQQIDAASDRLDLTYFPKFLYVTNRAYYFLLRGSIAQFRKQNAEAEVFLQKAQDLELPSDNERAMIKLQLANIAAQRNKWNQAKLYIRETKDMKITESTIKEQLAQFDQALKQQSAARNAQMQGGRRMYQGGKRRRPKMR